MQNDGDVAAPAPEPAPVIEAPQRIAGTRINKIVLEGFKSFAKRTEFLFGSDFNCIIGPNGSGKSNVTDALCFVLGKSGAKSMRAETSANLIYNGGKTGTPAKQAEVTIVFDNSQNTFPVQEDEIKLTRIVRKDGQSKYKINGKTHTREQMLELLSHARIEPDGHNIVLQGDVQGFCQMPSGERRQIIEEISGIGIYEERKLAALRDLQKVEERLNQAEIILKEREGFLKDLRKDRDQAMKYKELSDNIRTSKASFLKIQMDKREKELSGLQEKSGKHRKKLEDFNAKVAAFREQVSKDRLDLGATNSELEHKGEKEQISLSKEIEALRVQQATLTQQKQNAIQELTRIAQRREQLKESSEGSDKKLADIDEKKKEHEGRLGTIEKSLAEIAAHISVFKKKHNISEDTSTVEEQMRTLDTRTDEKTKELQQLSEKRQALLRDQDVNNYKLQTIDEQMKKVSELEKEHEKELTILRQKKEEYKKAVLELNGMLNDDSRLAGELARLRNSSLRLAEDLAKLEVKQAAVQESIAGNMAVKKILESRQQFGGVYGTVAELGQVSGKYSLALEVAASHRIHSVVVEDDAVASKCIKHLKDNRLGIATFLPLSKMAIASSSHEARKLLSEKGVIGLAIDLIKYDPRYRNAFHYVFGGTMVVDSLATARRLGVGRTRMVTLEGDLCEVSGAMVGGHRAKKQGVFRDDDVTGEIAKAQEEVGKIQLKVGTTEAEKKENEERINRLRELKATLEGEIIKTEKSLRIDTSDLDASKGFKKELQDKSKGLEKDLDSLADTLGEKTRELATLKTERQQLVDQLTSMRNPRVQAELNAFSEKRRELENEKLVLQTEVKNLVQKRAEATETSKFQDLMKQLDDDELKNNNDSKDFAKRLQQLDKDIKIKEKEQDKFQSKFKDLFAKAKKINERITEIEKKSFEHEQQARDEEQKMNAYGLEEARVKAEHGSLSFEFEQYSGVQLTLEKTEEQLKKELADFEKMQQGIGSVNMRALEIYDAAASEFGNLVKKKDSLLGEKDSVILMMNEIETKKKSIFLETFNVIQNSFGNVFSQLNSVGRAELVLENPETIFDGGMSIRIELAENKYLDLRSLSGGQKTLVGLAFIFAVQEYMPASFYVLDEVDAALDIGNDERLGKLIARYSDRAQYIVVTHKERVISEADILYGVSLGDHGASKMVSMKV